MKLRALSNQLLALLGALLVSEHANAQQESPLTDGMVEKDNAESTESATMNAQEPTPKPKVGEEYVDNPKWLADRISAEKEAERARAEAGKPASTEPNQPGYVPGYRRPHGVGLSPTAPQQAGVLPASTTPGFGAAALSEDLSFQFHGYLQSGLRAGVGSRPGALAGQMATTLHGDPLVPGAAYGWFEHTMTVPTPWAQLNFEFGNRLIRATAILAAWSQTQADQASGYFQGPAQLGFNSAFLTFTPSIGAAGLQVNAGVYAERYGAMGEYNAGAYGVSLIAAIYGMGATGTLTLPFDNDVTITTEAGFKGDFNKPPVGLVADQSNEIARPIEGSTYVGHGHVSFDFKRFVEVTGHAIYTFSQDDRGDALAGRDVFLGNLPRKDGNLTILGVDARFRLKRFGHLYVGGSHTIGNNALTVSNLVQILNNGPGRDLGERFWSFESGGNGTLTLFGGQYTLSLGTLLRHPMVFQGVGPDLLWSAFGIYAQQTSQQKSYSDISRLKVGTELNYSMLSWLAVAARADIVMPNMNQSSQSFGVLSPKLIFRTDWDNRATLTAQYSAYLLGEDTKVNGDNRLLNNPSGAADQHMLALFGTIWW